MLSGSLGIVGVIGAISIGVRLVRKVIMMVGIFGCCFWSNFVFGPFWVVTFWLVLIVKGFPLHIALMVDYLLLSYYCYSP